MSADSDSENESCSDEDTGVNNDGQEDYGDNDPLNAARVAIRDLVWNEDSRSFEQHHHANVKTHSMTFQVDPVEERSSNKFTSNTTATATPVVSVAPKVVTSATSAPRVASVTSKTAATAKAVTSATSAPRASANITAFTALPYVQKSRDSYPSKTASVVVVGSAPAASESAFKLLIARIANERLVALRASNGPLKSWPSEFQVAVKQKDGKQARLYLVPADGQPAKFRIYIGVYDLLASLSEESLTSTINTTLKMEFINAKNERRE